MPRDLDPPHLQPSTVVSEPVIGAVYSWKEVESNWGGEQTFLAKRNGRIICATLDRVKNPDAPDVMVVGIKPKNTQRGEEFCQQKGPVPLFIKEDTNQWRFHGHFESAKFSTDPQDIQKFQNSASGPLSMVIFLRKVNGQESLSAPLPGTSFNAISFQISPTIFRNAFERFKAIHIESGKLPFDSFANRNSFVSETEGYKNIIPDQAMAIMDPNRWSKSMIGKGVILQNVIDAIQIPGNNLLQWEPRKGPESRVHKKLIEAKTDSQECLTLETLFFELYKNKKTEKSVFDGIVAICGKRYELLGYLFFIAAPDRFLPIRTQSFDKVMGELGLALRTQGQCGWENYHEFIAVIREVQNRLHAEGVHDATLLDAHTFCWIIARDQNTVSEVVKIEAAKFVPFTGVLLPAAGEKKFTPKVDAEIRDMQNEAARRQASGQIAEEIALESEKERLCYEGHPELAARVVSVADRPGMGFDIQSFESDGGDRCIEVKNVSNGNQFFLSKGEWENCQGRSNYWFYLVSGVNSKQRLVTCMPAANLKSDQLQPVQYLVRYTSTPSISSS